MEKLFYTIGEVAGEIGESVSLVRFWSNYFAQFIKPRRNAKGNRQYTAQDIEVLKQIHYLVSIYIPKGFGCITHLYYFYKTDTGY